MRSWQASCPFCGGTHVIPHVHSRRGFFLRSAQLATGTLVAAQLAGCSDQSPVAPGRTERSAIPDTPGTFFPEDF
ncbi:MAG: hypothetical protein ACREMA_12725, partial [Longimicrobiales bacterium]